MPDKILLVDDDKVFRAELAEALDEYTIVHASSGREALDILEKPHNIDLVILDVRLPGASGTEVLKEIKSRHPDMGIIILTGYSSEDVAIEALKGRADEYIQKPLDILKTRDIIESLLARKRKTPALDASGIRGKIEMVKEFCGRNGHKKCSLEDAAAVVCLSPKYLSRIFREHTGVGFNEYKLKIKIARAKELLARTAYTVEQISDQMGYQNTESFIRIFKKFTGKTPTAFRQKRP